jgi:fatty-acyl-CoA synthase
VSAFTDALLRAAESDHGMTTGEPREPERRSWAQVHQAALPGAARLIDAGLRVGDAVALLAARPADVAPAAQAVWLAGGSVTMLHQPTARTDLLHFAVETQTALGVIGARFVVLGAPFDDNASLFDGTSIRALTTTELLAGDTKPQLPDVPEDGPALLQLTSGSTATPKAVRITHRNLWANIEGMCEAGDLRSGRDVMVSWLPLFHDMGMVGFLTLPMCRGIDVVKVTPTDFLTNPLLWPELISRYGGTVTAAPNFAYAITARVLPRAEALDLSTMRFALNGAEPIDVTACQSFLDAGAPFGLSPNAMVPAYGMAEATLGVSFHPWGTPLQIDRIQAEALENDRRAVPAATGTTRAFPVLGPPVPGIDVTVRGTDGTDGTEGTVLTDREVGVLHLRGEAVTELYLTVDGPQPTRDDDGWLDTGDLGYLVDGRVVVCGRVKDVIIMGGRNIYPTDIERVAEQVPGVRAGNAAAVRWTVGNRRESFAIAVESRAAGDPAATAGLVAAVRSAVTAEIGVRPAAVTVLSVGALPKTPSGKIKRSAAAGLIRAD